MPSLIKTNIDTYESNELSKKEQSGQDMTIPMDFFDQDIASEFSQKLKSLQDTKHPENKKLIEGMIFDKKEKTVIALLLHPINQKQTIPFRRFPLNMMMQKCLLTHLIIT